MGKGGEVVVGIDRMRGVGHVLRWLLQSYMGTGRPSSHYHTTSIVVHSRQATYVREIKEEKKDVGRGRKEGREERERKRIEQIERRNERRTRETTYRQARQAGRQTDRQKSTFHFHSLTQVHSYYNDERTACLCSLACL